MNLKDACRKRALIKAYGEHRELIEHMRWIGKMKAVVEQLPEGASLTYIIEGAEVKTLPRPRTDPIRIQEVPPLYYAPPGTDPLDRSKWKRLPGVISVQFDLAQMTSDDRVTLAEQIAKGVPGA